MSRVGKQPIVLPQGVKATIAGQLLKVEGPKGKLERTVRPEIKVEIKDGQITFARFNDVKTVRAFHGMERALVNNMVKGVSEGFSKELQLIGVGYRADQKGNTFNFALGYSHPVDFPLPAGIKGSVIKDNRDTYVKVEGADRQLVGQIAAQIRSLRAPEVYKGKGIRYKDEVISLKAGKAGKK
ncbi:50S ribosomal protein L6 [bacterium]|nr:50S ribosomal protein L6 [bacterium]